MVEPKSTIHISRPRRVMSRPLTQGRQHVAVGAAVGVERLGEPSTRKLARNVEGAALGVAHECDMCVLGNCCAVGRSKFRAEVSVESSIHGRRIQTSAAFRVAKAHQRHPHRRAVDRPRARRSKPRRSRRPRRWAPAPSDWRRRGSSWSTTSPTRLARPACNASHALANQ